MNAHSLFLAALLALTAVVEVGQHSSLIDRFVDQLNTPQRWAALPICNNVELTVACVPLADIVFESTAAPQ